MAKSDPPDWREDLTNAFVKQRPRYYRRGRAPKRYVTDSRAFMVDEKFDTMLDLYPYATWQQELAEIMTWDAEFINEWSSVISRDCMHELQILGVTPQDICSATLTPCIIAKMVNLALKRNIYRSTTSKVSDKTLREKACLASLEAVLHQYDHMSSAVTPRIMANFHTKPREKIVEKFKCLPAEVEILGSVVEDCMRVMSEIKMLHKYVRIKDGRARARFRLHRRLENPWMRLDSLGVRLLLTRDVSILEVEGRTYLVNHDLILMMINKLVELWSLMLYCHFQDGTNQDEGIYTLQKDFIVHITDLVLRSGKFGDSTATLTQANKGFLYCKSLEGLFVAECIYRHDFIKGWDNQTLGKTLWKALKEEGLPIASEWRKSVLVKMFEKYTMPQIAEVIGTVKIAGHPSIEVEKGLDKLYERTHELLEIDSDAVQKTIGVLTRELFMNFHRVHGHYPLCELRADLHGAIRRTIIERLGPTHPVALAAFKNTDALEWSKVKLLKNAEFDPVDNQLQILKDKALGVTRSKILQVIFGTMPTHEETLTMKTENRRALIHFLLNDHYSSEFHKYLSEIKKSEGVSEMVKDYLVIKLTAKELELKAEGRMFGASPAVERNRRIVNDKNVMDMMSLYDPRQLITPDELSIIKKLFSFRHYASMYHKHTLFQISFDFSKWNNRMRKESIDVPAQEFYDRFYGESYIGRTMHMFNNTLYYYARISKNITKRNLTLLNDVSEDLFQLALASLEKTTKKVQDSELRKTLHKQGQELLAAVQANPSIQNWVTLLERCNIWIGKYHTWVNQLGGIEGLAQPVWTSIFGAFLVSALEPHFPLFDISYKGDDVRAVIAVPDEAVKNKGHDGVRQQIMDVMRGLCDQMGWELNPNESFVSLSVICTSKQYQVNDTWLPASNKKMMKMMSMSNLVFPTLPDLIGSIYSTAHSACAQTTVALPAYCAATYCAAREMLREFGEMSVDADGLTALLLWPQILGGPGPLPLQTFMIRGENDMLSAIVALYTHVFQTGSPGLSHRLRSILQVPMKKTPDKAMLLADPYSVPISAPEQPQAVLKRMMKTSMAKWVRNKDIRSLLSAQGLADKTKYVAHLLSMKPYAAKVATMLWECSPFYVVEEVLAKFTQSSTIFQFLTTPYTANEDRARARRAAYRALDKMLDAAQRCLVFWSKIVSNRFIKAQSMLGIPMTHWLSTTTCPTQLTMMIREKAWNREIIGLTYPSLVVQNMVGSIDELRMLHPNWRLDNIVNNIYVQLHNASSQTDTDSYHYRAVKGNVPWLGAYTRNDLADVDYRFRIRSTTLSKLKKLFELWKCGESLGPSFQQSVKVHIQALTSYPLKEALALVPEVGGGHLAHRGVIASTSRVTMNNARPNIMQGVRYESEGLSILKGDQTDYSLNYAARQYISILLATWPLQFSLALPEDYPQLLHAYLHWDLAHPDTYRPCPYCLNDIGDVMITFMLRCPT
nr:polymerase [Rice thrips mononega-like virus 1]